MDTSGDTKNSVADTNAVKSTLVTDINRLGEPVAATTAGATLNGGATANGLTNRFPALNRSVTGKNESNPARHTQKEFTSEQLFNAWLKSESLKRSQSGDQPLRLAAQAAASYRAWLETQAQPDTVKSSDTSSRTSDQQPPPSGIPSPGQSVTTQPISSRIPSKTAEESGPLSEISRLKEELSRLKSSAPFTTTGNPEKKRKSVQWPSSDRAGAVVVSNGRVISGDPYADTVTDAPDEGDDTDGEDLGDADSDDDDSAAGDAIDELIAKVDAVQNGLDLVALAVVKIENAMVGLAKAIADRKL